MIALTQEKREELIERYSQQIITFKYHLSQIGQEHFDGKAYAEMLLKTEIALAALTAAPKAYLVGEYHLLHHQNPDIDLYPNAAPLFLAPPVPEIKLPSRIENIHLRTPLEVEDMWIDRFKRLNGLGE